MSHDIYLITKKDEDDWDDFVDHHPRSTMFHTTHWKKIIENTFGYSPEYLIAKTKDNRTIGICPAFMIRTLFNPVIISQPFFEYGGPMLEQNHEDLYDDILNYYKSEIDNGKAKYVEFRALDDCADRYYERNGYKKLIKALDFSIDVKGKNFEKDIWEGLYTKKSRVRNSVRNAIKNGLTIIEENNINNYYELYIKTMSKLGSPVFPKAFFDNIIKYAKSTRFTFAYLERKPIAAIMSFPQKERYLMVGLVSDPDYQNFHANDLLYNEQIEYATKNNYTIVDFGRTRPNSSYEQFKSKWGATRTNLYSYLYPASKNEDVNPYKYYLMASNITKHIPWIFTKTPLGPYLIKKFP